MAFMLAACLFPDAQGQIVLNAPEFDKVLQEVERRMDDEGRDMVGIVLPMDVDFMAEAEMSVEGNHRVWRMMVKAKDALANCLYFDDFYLPPGAELNFSTPKGRFAEQWEGAPVTSLENNAHHRWCNDEVPGDEVLVELMVPRGVTEPARLHAEGLGYFVRGNRFPAPFDFANDRGGSDACQVDVNCPEGDSWACEKDGVVKLRVTQGGGIFLCSGSMVNNTAKDCRQLMLTSLHCADEVDDDEWPYFKVQFNYEFSECGGTSSVNSHTRTGVIHLTDSDDMVNGQIQGSDFLLVEVEDPIDTSWTPFFAGWDASGNPGHGGVGIHHPSGDRKKISTYGGTLTTSSGYAPGAHWKVYWTATETNHGVTEGGSSGSPIFSENHHIVGTLSGGSSFCSAPYAPDLYGKMNRHWDVNGLPDTLQLSSFLDPLGTGQLALNGSYKHVDASGAIHCDVMGACEATLVEESFLNGLAVLPNPSAGRVRVALPEGFALDHVDVYDSMGRLHQTLNAQGMGRAMDLDLMSMGPGMVYVTVHTRDGWSTTRRVVLN